MTIHSQSTPHLVLQYDDAVIPANVGDACLVALKGSGENDFAILQAIFGGTTPAQSIVVTVINGAGGVNNGRDTSIGASGAGPFGSFDGLRSAYIAEVSEIFMSAQAKGWQAGDSKGEALSRALSGVMYPQGQQPMFTVHQWVDNLPDARIDGEASLGASGRQDWVSRTFKGNAQVAGDNPAKTTGCGVAFLYYLHVQLGFTWTRIVTTQADDFEGIYRGLTGSSGGWTAFDEAVTHEFPPGVPSNLNGDSRAPFSDGFEQQARPAKEHPRALVSPNALTPTPLRTARRCSVKRYLGSKGIHGRVGLRDLAVDAAGRAGGPRGHDSMSSVGVRGLVNGQRQQSLI